MGREEARTLQRGLGGTCSMKGKQHDQHYGHLFLMLVLSVASMYALMYAMTADFASVYLNLNQLYMALLMAAPMGIIELAVMRSMYADRRMNAAVMAGSLVVLLGAWVAIRQQAAIADGQFLRSMIPHHSSAILMCERATLTDPAIQALCKSIIEGQQAEIDLMKAKLNARGE